MRVLHFISPVIESPERTYRIVVEDERQKHRILLMAPRDEKENFTFVDKQTWGILITNHNGNPDTLAQDYGETIAHELGHVLMLGHRHPQDDGLAKPVRKNLMQPPQIRWVGTEPFPPSEDLDLIQLVATRGSHGLTA